MVFHRARPWRARRPAFGTRAGTRLRGTPAVSLEIADLTAPPLEAPATPDRPPISVLGIRRRYWEMTHGWTIPAQPQGTPDMDAPGRVA
ncbi:MAG: hypothetical protein U0075_06845 [Thermomicrobiales bacterium]